MPTKIIYTPHYTTVGSPTISDEYVASNFSGSNYLTLPVTIDSTDDTWEVYLNFTSTSYDYQHIFGVANDNNAILISAESGVIRMYLSSGSSWGIAGAVGDFAYSLNVHYYVKLQFTGTNYILSVSTDEENWTVSANVSSSTKIASGKTLYFGSCWDRNTNYLRGSSDLKKFYIKKNGVKAWEAVTVTEVETSGTVSVSKGYYDNGSNKIQMTSAITKYLTELSSGETTGCKNKLFAYSYNNTPGIKITANSNSDITTTHDVSVELDKNVYLSALKNYIVGHTPLQTIPMQIGGELTTDYTPNDPSAIDSDYILHSTAQGKYVYKNFSESDITTGEITLKCKQTAIKYRSDVIAGWALIGFAEGYLGMWDGSGWRTNTYYPVGTWVWVKVVYTPATYNFKIYGLVDNGYTLETLPDLSQWTLEYSGQPTGTHFMTQALYLPDAGSEWFQGDIDLKTVQVKKNGVEIWRAVSTPANSIKNSSNGFVYDSTNDKTFWYPTETILKISGFSSLEDRCNLYLANEDGKDVSRFIAGSSLPGPVKTNYVVEGSPTINSSYEASNFTNDNYISIPETIPSTDGTTIITAISLTGSPPSDTGGVLSKTTGVPNVYIHDSMKLGCYDGDYSQAGPTTMAANTKYWLGIRYYSSSTQFFLLQDNGYTLDTLPPITNWNLEFYFNNKNEFGGSNIILGKLNAGLPFTVGTIYLEDTAIYSGGTYVWKAVEQNPVITSAMQQGYVYLNHAHNKVIGIGDEPDEVELETKVTTKTDYTVNGSPTITDDYIGSNWSGSNYLTIPETIDNTADSWEIGFSFITTSPSTGQFPFGCVENNTSILFSITASNFQWFLCSTGSSSFDIAAGSGSYSLSSNTKYYVKAQFTGTQYILSLSTDGENWTVASTINSTTKVAPNKTLYIGSSWGRSNEYLRGSIDLKDCYIKINGSEVWRAIAQVNNYVKVSDSHYWTYLGDSSYDCEGSSLAVSSMSPSALTGHLMMTTAGVLSYSEVNAQLSVGGLLPGAAYTGYDVTFTDNTYTTIDSVDKVGTRYRIYRSAGINPEAPIEFVAMSYDDYGSFAGGALPSASESYGLTVDSPIEYTSTTTFTLSTDEIQSFDYYNPTEDKFYVYETGLWTGYQALSYIGDMYIIDSTGA